MNRFILVRIKTPNKSKILLKLNKINVVMQNITYKDKYIYFEILYEDLKRVKKYLISEKVEVIDETGIYKIKKELKKNMLFIVGIIFSVLIFLILSNIIVEVNIIHSSKEIRELLSDALKEEGVTRLTFKKSYDKYEHIISKIKDKYKDRIEWLEIDVDGMVLNIRVEERIENNISKNYNTCHIVASKSGIIKNILTKKGVAEVKINDHVAAGDILISGEIKLNEEIKENVCADGDIEAEVWYTINASMPLKYNEEKVTNKMRYNFIVKSPFEEYYILKSRVGENKKVEKTELFQALGYEFYLAREYETKVTTKTYTEEEALQKLQKEIEEKLTTKGSKVSDIITQKYLKKSINNGNLDIEMFVAVKEQIGVVKYYNVETDSGTNDEEYRGHSN